MNEPTEAQPLLPSATSLSILLILFFCIAIGTVLSVLFDRAEGERVVESASVAHGPAEYAKILDEDFTQGLDPDRSDVAFQVPPPPFTPGAFPCSECHADLPPDPKVRVLESAHTEIVLRHGGEDRWCLDCHDLTDRDHLRLANGTLVPFAESYRLCGQCHGDKYRDWRSGIHGKRTGYWNGPKRYLLCAHCHNPHSPHFQALVPLAPPVRPEFQRASAAGH